MGTPSFIKRLIRSVVTPNERALAERRARHVIEIWRSLLSERGEVSGAVLAREALTAYVDLPETALAAFFDQLAHGFAPDEAALLAACDAYRAQPSPASLARLQQAVESPRQELFRRLNQAPGGTSALVEARRNVLSALADHPDWKTIDADLAHLFASWFNRGFLTLERVDWHTPAIVLEKLIKYEAVHAISGWRDLRRRLESDRRCFAFFHPALPEEPLIFIEVALVKGMSNAIQPLLDVNTPVADADNADTAVFYSITNCQEGLRGISFGNLLIKQVAQKLGEEFPRIRAFATLSPIPGFHYWLNSVEASLDATAETQAALAVIRDPANTEWMRSEQSAESVRKALLPLCAYYLLHAMRNNEPADNVARFHLGNGARVERLNWLADTSPRGMQRSAGLMVNYLYRLDQVEENHEIYVKEHRVVASHEMRRLARECALAQPLRTG